MTMRIGFFAFKRSQFLKRDNDTGFSIIGLLRRRAYELFNGYSLLDAANFK